MASIYRSDLTLVLSRFETDLLKDRFRIDEALIQFLGFSYPPIDRSADLPFQRRKHFASIGNFRHLPNRDATFWLARRLCGRNSSPTRRARRERRRTSPLRGISSERNHGARFSGDGFSSVRPLMHSRFYAGIASVSLLFGSGPGLRERSQTPGRRVFLS